MDSGSQGPALAASPPRHAVPPCCRPASALLCLCCVSVCANLASLFTPPPPARLPALAAGELSGDNIEVAVVGEDRVFRVLTPAEVSDYLQEVE